MQWNASGVAVVFAWELTCKEICKRNAERWMTCKNNIPSDKAFLQVGSPVFTGQAEEVRWCKVTGFLTGQLEVRLRHGNQEYIRCDRLPNETKGPLVMMYLVGDVWVMLDCLAVFTFPLIPISSAGFPDL